MRRPAGWHWPRAAEHSIDSQYYIWHDDTAGILLLNALHEAAGRGVRVRLLLDDNGVAGLDDVMSALNAQVDFETLEWTDVQLVSDDPLVERIHRSSARLRW